MDALRREVLDLIDKVVYINLLKRPDRHEHMKKITSIFGSKVERFEAIESTHGKLGCSMSHIAVIRNAISSNYKNILILEDDAEWNETEKGYKNLLMLMSNPFDVILLGGGYCNFDNKTLKLSKANHTHAYLTNNHYYSKLLSNFEEGASHLENLGPNLNTHKYGIDVYWLNLMRLDNWFIVLPNLLYQKASYSDIDGCIREHKNNVFLLNDTLDVKRALWGFYSNIIDVTEEVKLMERNNEFILKYTMFKIDPFPGKTKCLLIEYTDGSTHLGVERVNINIIGY